MPRVLSIAGSDPSGGAGIQADLKSIAAVGGYGMAALTALTAQNTRGVRGVHVPPAEFLRAQLDAISDDIAIDAVKIGMLANAEVIAEVADWLRQHRPGVVVVDPVMVATSGDRLLDAAAERALGELLPLADLVTPNLAELAVLAGAPAPAESWAEALEQAVDGDVHAREHVAHVVQHAGGDLGHAGLARGDDELLVRLLELAFGAFLRGHVLERAFAEQRLAGRRGDEAEDGECGDGFAATGLADDGEGLAGVNGVGDVADGADLAAFGIEGDVEVLELEEGLFGHGVWFNRYV